MPKKVKKVVSGTATALTGIVPMVESWATVAQVGKWAFFVGVILAILAAFVSIPYLGVILVVVGLIIGLLNIAAHETNSFLIATIALMAVGAAGLGTAATVGGYVESILKNIISFVAPAALVVALKSVLTLAR